VPVLLSRVHIEGIGTLTRELREVMNTQAMACVPCSTTKQACSNGHKHLKQLKTDSILVEADLT